MGLTMDNKTNIVDELVAMLITDYFTIFPTREHVLSGILLGIGNGCEWKKGKDGLYYIAHPKRYRNLEKIPSFEEEYPYFVIESEADRADVEFQNMVIDWTNRHIKEVSSMFFHHYNHRLTRPMLRSWCSEFQLIAEKNLPPREEIHPDWCAAIERFCEDTLVRMRQEIACPHTKEDLEVSYAEWLTMKGFGNWSELARLCQQAAHHVVSEETRAERKAFIERVTASILEKVNECNG